MDAVCELQGFIPEGKDNSMMLTTPQAAARLGYKLPSSVNTLIKVGRMVDGKRFLLPAHKVGRDWLIEESDLEAFMQLPKGKSGWRAGRPRGKKQK